MARSNTIATNSRRNATHIQVLCGKCHTTVVDHKGEDIGKGLLRLIERDLALLS